jgi:hypothetical protein
MIDVMRLGLAAASTALGALAVIAAIASLGACRGETFASGGADAGAVDAPSEGAPDAPAVGDGRSARYAQVVLSDAPIAYWRLDDTSTTGAALDQAGGHPGAIAPTVQVGVPGALGPGDLAMAFGKIDANVKVDDPKAFDFVGNAPFTVEAWFATTDRPSGSGRIAAKNTMDPLGWVLAVESNGELQFDRYPAVGVDDAVHTAVVTDGAWHHVVVTYDGSALAAYVDGALPARGSSSSSAVSASAATFTLGTGSGGGAQYVGALDEVAIYDKALSSARVAAHYAAGTGP